MSKLFNVVLVHPEIPQNTGNISRTCAVTDTALHIIRPIGFEISDRTLRRAGLDYWHLLDVTYYDSYEEFLQKHGDSPLFFFTAGAANRFDRVEYPAGSFLVFGKESSGLEPEILEGNAHRAVRIPMRGGVRCLNLSNAVAVALYRALDGQGYPDFE